MPHASVLFVCLGNICRSPMAEGVFRSLTSSQPSPTHTYTISSCGTDAYHAGDGADPRTLATLSAHKMQPANWTHRARKIALKDFEEFDYVLAMDEGNLRRLREMVERGVRDGKLEDGVRGKVKLLGEFGGKDGGREVVGDPYYGGDEGFERVFEQVLRCCRGLIASVEGEGKARV